MLRVIGVTSGKGGVGKTVTVANLGLVMRKLKRNVILVDADLSTSNLGLHFGLYQFQPFYIQDVLRGEVTPKKAFFAHPTGLKIVPSSLRLGYLNVRTLEFRIKRLLKGMDGIVLIDSPPGLDEESLSVLKACDEIIVVTNPDVPSVVDSTKVVHVARELEKNVLGVVVNRAEEGKYELKPEEIEVTTEAPVISVIPEDKNVKRSIFEKTPLVDYRQYSPAALEFKKLGADLLGLDYSPPRFPRLKNMFSR